MAKLPLNEITVIVDTREQLPYDLSPFNVIRKKLDQGDYALQGLDYFIERKSLEDLIGCIGSSRDRFKRELERLRGRGMVVVEASIADLYHGEWRGQITPAQAIGSVYSWQTSIPFCFAGNRQRAQECVFTTLRILAQKRHQLKAVS